MNKNIMQWIPGALLVLIGITGVCIYEFVITQQKNVNLQAELEQVQQEIGQLELVRDNLSTDLDHARASEKALFAENTGLKDQLKVDQERFTTLEMTIQEAQNNIDSLNAQISIARQENAALATQIDGLKTQLSAVNQEKDRMAETLSSVDALKNAIRELRHKTKRVRQSAPVTIVADAKKQVKEITLGNRGFIIKDGKVLTPSRVKIEVQPSSDTSQ